MTFRTIVLSTNQAYLEYLNPSDCRPFDERAVDDVERVERLIHFPHSVMLEASFAEFDFINRWCWQNFGSAQGECFQLHGDYPTCTLEEHHSHTGKWTSCFLEKSDYNFGFCEWYFADKSMHESFHDHLPSFNWGEKYPIVYPVY